MKKAQILMSITLVSGLIISTPFLSQAGRNNAGGNYGNEYNHGNYENHSNYNDHSKYENHGKQEVDYSHNNGEKPEYEKEREEHNAYINAKKAYNYQKGI